MNTTRFAEYLKAITGDETGRQIAQKVGTSESAISRWKAGSHVPDPKQAVSVARAYNRSPLEALIAAGWIDDHETGLPIEQPAPLRLHELSDLELAEEIVRRAKKPGPLTEPLDDTHPAMNPISES